MAGRPRNAVAGRDLHLVLAEAEASRVDLHLWSEAEQRIPNAARQRFFTSLIREFFSREGLDLAPYFNELPTGSLIWGPPSLVAKLREALESQ